MIMKMTMVERQPPPHFHAATPARHPRKGPSIVNSSLAIFAVMKAVPVRYISRPALSNFKPPKSNLILFAGYGNSDATVSHCQNLFLIQRLNVD